MKHLYSKNKDFYFIVNEHLIFEIKQFNREFYTKENLANHIAYLSDIKPGRRSYAYAISNNNDLPSINIPSLEDKYPRIHLMSLDICKYLGVSRNCRLLFNIQEYYDNSTEVPKHNDGELLEFTVNSDGNLEIQESLRPAKVAVLTVVNDVPGGVGTRLWQKDTTEVVKCKAGDLLVFDNINCLHSVDSFSGQIKRRDGLLRLIIGWRSLDESCVHEINGAQNTKSTEELKELTKNWLTNKWPSKWVDIEKDLSKAAF